MILNAVSFCCPLILCSLGAVYSEFTGCLALFLDGIVCFSAFLFFAFFELTKSLVLSIFFTVFFSAAITAFFSFLTEKFNSNKFIAAIGLNLLFSALPSTFSSQFFNTRGILNSPELSARLPQFFSNAVTIIITIILVIAGILFLQKTRTGLYIRISGTDSDVLLSKGVNPKIPKIFGWTITSIYASFAGCFLTMKICSFVPNISSGRGWLALAAVFLGKKGNLTRLVTVKIIICVVIFCIAELFSANIQNFIPQIPTSVLISFPYIIVLCLAFFTQP